jgi:hypothetical protein
LEEYPFTKTMTMTRTRTTKNTQPAAGDLQVTPEPDKIKSPVIKQEDEAPVNLETESLDEEPVSAPEATPAEKIQTDVREKLSKKSVDENVFVPTNPVALEKAAAEVAKESGFDLTRGTSIGARLLARAQKRF